VIFQLAPTGEARFPVMGLRAFCVRKKVFGMNMLKCLSLGTKRIFGWTKNNLNLKTL
jgi:hypothetical protein